MILDQLVSVVKEAAEVMNTEHFSISMKGDVANIVTSSDLAVQEFLCKRLSELMPGCGFICEEENAFDDTPEYVWVIDPIDGTANYARGVADCCISVALKKNDKVEMGVVYSPARHELYCAQRGYGAYMNGRRIEVSERPFAAGILCAALSTYRKELAPICRDVLMDAYMQCNDFRRYGSAAIELCQLACGRCDLYFEIRLQPWDYAAAWLIVEEAGGILTGLDGGPMPFTRPSLVVGANNRANYEKMYSIVRSYITELPYED